MSAEDRTCRDPAPEEVDADDSVSWDDPTRWTIVEQPSPPEDDGPLGED